MGIDLSKKTKKTQLSNQACNKNVVLEQEKHYNVLVKDQSWDREL